MMTRFIAELLFSHECVIVPGLGGFIKSNNPAFIRRATNEFYPPAGNIAFNSALATNDGQLASYIATSKEISYNEALSEIKTWVGKCHETLKKENTIILEGIGELFINSSGKLEFLPARDHNFNADSFGLPVFTTKVPVSIPVEVPVVEHDSVKYKGSGIGRLVTETLKWAAVLAPFIAFALWGSFNRNIINNYVHNYTGMYSWVRSTPGKTVPVSLTAKKVVTQSNPEVKVQSPAEILANENISFDPGMISYAELAKQNITIDKNKISQNPETFSQPETSYHIVGGAFRDHDNALKLIQSLSIQGYTAAIIDTTPGGLYVVSMAGFATRNEAEAKLSEIKKNGFPTSWIMKKHKV